MMGHRLVANSVIAIVSLLSLFCCLTEQTLWPFAPYTMYSISATTYWPQYYLEGEGEGGQTICLTTGDYLKPFDNKELLFKIFSPLVGKGPHQQVRLEERLRLLRRHYMDRLQRKEHSGPPLVAIRLYRVCWKLAPEASNLGSPDRKTLIREVRW